MIIGIARAVSIRFYFGRHQRLAHYRQGIWAPLTPAEQGFWRLLKRRATLLRAKVQRHHSLVDLGSLQADVDVLLKDIDQVLHKMDRALMGHAQRLGWAAEVERCRALPGVGPLTALASVALDHRGEFVRADAFIAVMGMDVRVRQSGQWRGRRKLTKKGDHEVRRLLFNPAMQARRSPLWEPY